MSGKREAQEIVKGLSEKAAEKCADHDGSYEGLFAEDIAQTFQPVAELIALMQIGADYMRGLIYEYKEAGEGERPYIEACAEWEKDARATLKALRDAAGHSK